MERERASHARDDDDDDRGWLDLEHLARYSCLSITTLRRYLRHPTRPLPHRRLGGANGRVLVRKRDFDQWLLDQHTPAAEDSGDWARRTYASLLPK